MAEEKNNTLEAEDDDEELDVVELTDEETGETYLYVQEMVIPVDGNNYALLVPYSDEDEDDGAGHKHEHGDTCDCCGEEEGDAFFAKIVTDENGEESYEVLTDDEFDAAMAAYEKLMDEAEAEEAKNEKK